MFADLLAAWFAMALTFLKRHFFVPRQGWNKSRRVVRESTSGWLRDQQQHVGLSTLWMTPLLVIGNPIMRPSSPTGRNAFSASRKFLQCGAPRTVEG